MNLPYFSLLITCFLSNKKLCFIQFRLSLMLNSKWQALKYCFPLLPNNSIFLKLAFHVHFFKKSSFFIALPTSFYSRYSVRQIWLLSIFPDKLKWETTIKWPLGSELTYFQLAGSKKVWFTLLDQKMNCCSQCQLDLEACASIFFFLHRMNFYKYIIKVFILVYNSNVIHPEISSLSPIISNIKQQFLYPKMLHTITL